MRFLYNVIQKGFQQHAGRPVTFFMDNASIRKSKLMKFYFMRGHSILFNAPYSPQLNPIELVFSLIKRKVREAHPEDLKNLINCIIEACKTINLVRTKNLIRHSLRFLKSALDSQDLI